MCVNMTKQTMETAFAFLGSMSELINLSLADEGSVHRLCPQTLCLLFAGERHRSQVCVTKP